MKRLLLSLALLAFGCASLFAGSFAELRSAAGKKALSEGFTLEGIVVSDCDSYNTALNPNLAWNKVDVAYSLETVYVEATDGSEGVRLHLTSLYGNRFHRGTLVAIDLGGLKVTDGYGLYIDGVDAKRLRVLSENAPVPVKKKRIAELSERDVNTLVTLTGVEFLSKQGSLINIYEPCAQKVPDNRLDPPQRAADGWAALLEDADGNSIYMQLNSKCAGRRNRLDFPKGVGELSGIVVKEYNRRYGFAFEPFSIRPILPSDIAIPLEESSSFRTVASWRWDHNHTGELNFRDSGRLRWLGSPGKAGDAVLAESGNGQLYTDSGAGMLLGEEYDARHSSDGSGKASRAGAALRLESHAADWFGGPDGFRSIIVETSTEGITGKGLIFNFSFVAGDHTLKKSAGFPAHWCVEYSTDAKAWTATGFRASLRPIAFPRALLEHYFYDTFYDCAMGFPEFSIKLPESLLGQKRLLLRLRPADTVLTAIVTDPSADIESAKAKPDAGQDFVLRIGMMELKAY